MKRRMIYLFILILTGIFASFFGGAARVLFYSALLVPVISLIYTLYVYFRFRIFQNAEKKTVIKGEKIPYYFFLPNDDFITYADVKVTFLEGRSALQDLDFSRSYILAPGESEKKHTEVLCKYRGEYNIGIKDITVTDFLGLFSIRYKAPTTVNMRVYPRIVDIRSLSAEPADSDAKKSRFSALNSGDEIDREMRKYVQGDSLKLINWKVSAKKQELFVCRHIDIPKSRAIFIMDIRKCEEDELSCSIIEDKIIESVLAVTRYFLMKKTSASVAYGEDKSVMQEISSAGEFNAFHSKCKDIIFNGRLSPEQIIKDLKLDITSDNLIMIAVHNISEKLCEVCRQMVAAGNNVVIFYISDSDSKYSKILDSRIIFKQILLSDEISDILEGSHES